jgi:hypothetical protein
MLSNLQGALHPTIYILNSQKHPLFLAGVLFYAGYTSLGFEDCLLVLLLCVLCPFVAGAWPLVFLTFTFFLSGWLSLGIDLTSKIILGCSLSFISLSIRHHLSPSCAVITEWHLLHSAIRFSLSWLPPFVRGILFNFLFYVLFCKIYDFHSPSLK